MMKVVGEEGTSLDDYVLYLESEFLDHVYLQQNAFDPVDASTSAERQRYVFALLIKILLAQFDLQDKAEARTFFYTLRQGFLDLNGLEWDSEAFKGQQAKLEEAVAGKRKESPEEVEELFKKTFNVSADGGNGSRGVA